MATALPPITPEGLGGCLLWFNAALSGRDADPRFLTRGFPQGRMKSARVQPDGSIAVEFEDQHYDAAERSERIFDAEGLFVFRMALAPKTHVRVDRNAPGLHYVTMYGDITAIRFLAGAQRDQAARQIGKYPDLRRENLGVTDATPGPKVKPIHQDRELAINHSLVAYEKLPASHWLRRLLTKDDLAWVLNEGFRFLDNLPLGSLKAVVK